MVGPFKGDAKAIGASTDTLCPTKAWSRRAEARGSCLALGFIVLTLGVGLLVARLPLGVVGLRFIYRVASGWLRLVDRRPMYESPARGRLRVEAPPPTSSVAPVMEDASRAARKATAPATGFVISFLRWAPGLPRRPRARLP
jgi:hypothetical protein